MKNAFNHTPVHTGIILLGLACALSYQGCQTDTYRNPNVKDKYVLPDSLYRTLEIATVKKCRVVNTITLTGQVDFNEDNVVKIYPLVSGNVQDVRVMLGDYVQKGQVLAVVKSGDMAGYSSALVNAETNLQVAKKSLDATTDMYKSGLAAEKDLLAAQASYAQAQSALNQAKEVIQINGGGARGNYIVRAPISGFIVEKQITNNMAIRSDNGTDMFTISDLKNVWVLANVYESSIGSIHLGDSVNITTLSYPGRIFKGKVDKLMNVLDPTNKVMKIRIVLNNPGYLLKPQMFASVNVFNPEDKEMLCVPSKAIIFDHSQYYVVVYRSNSDISIAPVQVAMTTGDSTYISSGVQEGDRVIASQTLLIYQALNS